MTSKLAAQLQNDLTASVKAKDRDRAETLRFVLAAVKNYEIAHFPPSSDTSMSDHDVITVLQKQAKRHRESIEEFEKGNRPELVQKEKGQLAIIATYIPKELTDEELREMVTEVMKSGEDNFGVIMRGVMQKVAGRADGKRVTHIVKSML